MNRRNLLVTASGILVSVLAGCGGGGDDGGEQGEIVETIELRDDDAFHPKTVSISPGEAVEWVNKTGSTREVRATSNVDGAEEWDFQGRMEANDGSTVYTFQEPGVYAFHDSINTEFLTCGAVAVGEASIEDVSLPC